MTAIRDFLGHELAVGDIVVWGSGMAMHFARITGFEGAVGYHGVQVITIGLGADRQAPNNYKYWDPEQLIWHTSAYQNVPDIIVMDVLGYAERYGHDAG